MQQTKINWSSTHIQVPPEGSSVKQWEETILLMPRALQQPLSSSDNGARGAAVATCTQAGLALFWQEEIKPLAPDTEA